MKHVRYTAAAILLGSLLMTNPLMASAPVHAISDPAVAEHIEPTAEEKADIQKKASVARQEIVARVNGVAINMYDLLGMMNRVSDVYYRDVAEPTPEVTNEIRHRALDRLIFEELAIQEAKKRGIEPPPEKINMVIDEIREGSGTPEKFQEYLDGIALTEEGLRDRIYRGRLLEGITGREVYQKVNIEESDVDRLYEEYKEAGKLQMADRFVVKEILMMEAADKEEVRANAERILAELKANSYDSGKLVLDGTFITRKLNVKKEKYPVIYGMMQNMKIDEWSGIVEDNGQLHILRVLENEPARVMTREEARGMLKDRLAPYSQEKRRNAWMKELREDAKVEILLEDVKDEK